jgi:hypothetical protein
MKDKDRAEALKKLTSDAKTVKILADNPRINEIVQEARTYKPVPGYHRISLYYHHKARVLSLLKEPDAGEIYGLIGDLLPMDASDKDSDEPCISGVF